MKIYRNILRIGLPVLFLNAGLLAQAPKYSNEFLKIGVGARAHGMGTAVTSSIGQAEAAFWNPAGLSWVEAPLQLAAMHSEWFAGIAQYDYIGLAKTLRPENSSVLAISLIRMGIDNIPYTINLIEPDGSFNYDNISSFSSADYGVFFSYAQALRNPDWRLGSSVKIVHRSVGSFGRSWGFGLDAGLQYRKGGLQLGLMARDISTTFNAWSFSLNDREKEVYTLTGNSIPVSSTEITLPSFILAAGYEWSLGKSFSLLSELDFEITTDGQRNVLVSGPALNIDPRLGIELAYNKLVFLRGGINNVQRYDFIGDTQWTVQPNFGIGLRFGRFQIDYAISRLSANDDALYSHLFSAALTFKARKPDPLKD